MLGILLTGLSFLRGLSPRTWGIIILIIAVVATLLYAKHLGYKECKVEQLNANLLQKDKFNEIANNRPDFHTLIKRLQDGSF